jgi:hypothetical protein
MADCLNAMTVRVQHESAVIVGVIFGPQPWRTIVAPTSGTRRFVKGVNRENLGGDQFFAVSVLYGPGMDPKGKFPLAVSNSQDVPIYDAAFAITRRGDFFQNGIEFSVGTIYPHDILRRVYSAALLHKRLNNPSPDIRPRFST